MFRQGASCGVPTGTCRLSALQDLPGPLGLPRRPTFPFQDLCRLGPLQTRVGISDTFGKTPPRTGQVPITRGSFRMIRIPVKGQQQSRGGSVFFWRVLLLLTGSPCGFPNTRV